MKFQDYSMSIAYRMGSYQALAGMMADAIRELNAAQDSYDRKWATQRLTMLAEQYAETHAKYEAEAAV